MVTSLCIYKSWRYLCVQRVHNSARIEVCLDKRISEINYTINLIYRRDFISDFAEAAEKSATINLIV